MIKRAHNHELDHEVIIRRHDRQHPVTREGDQGTAVLQLRLLETTDIHVNLTPYDYYADRPSGGVGLTRTASLIRQAREEAQNCLLLDNGDFLQGSPMGDFAAYAREASGAGPHPAIAAMNALGVDAATLGNHEFNYGLEFLLSVCAEARFPVVCANVARRAGATPCDDDTLLPPFVLLRRDVVDETGQPHALTIGVIGFVPPQIMVWDARRLSGRVVARDILPCARAWVPRLREAGADLIVALSHSGIGHLDEVEGMENASLALAGIPGIDAVLAGHSHRVFPDLTAAPRAGVDHAGGTFSGTPAVMAGCWGSHLGVIDLTLVQDRAGWRVTSSRSEARPISHRDTDGSAQPLVEPDADLAAVLRADHEATLAYIRRPVGRTTKPLRTYFAQIGEVGALRVVTRAQSWYVAELLSTGPYADLPLLSAAAPFKAGGLGGPDHYTDVPAGDLAIKNAADLYIYPNSLRAVCISGAELRGWLERSAGMFRTISPGSADAPLLEPAFPTYNFDVIDGVRYRIDLSAAPIYSTDGSEFRKGPGRIRDLTFNGQPIGDHDRFVVATNDFRAGGGGAFPGGNGQTIILQAPDFNRDVVIRFLLERGIVDVPDTPIWEFAPMPGTSVLFESSPAASNCLSSLGDRRIEPVGTDARGFALFRLHL